MKNTSKILTLSQVEECLQLAIDKINVGKPSYTRQNVMQILKAIYNALLHTATENAIQGFKLPTESEEENVII